MKIEFTATNDDLMEQVKKNLSNINYNQIKEIFRKKDVKVNGLRQSKSVFLKGGEKVEVFYTIKDKTVNVVYEDENILVAEKPQGVETTLKDKTLTNNKCLEEYFPNLIAVHRLDLNTHGLVILAKNKEVYENFINIFKKNQIEKHYMAIVCGKLKTSTDLLTSYAKKINGFTRVFKNKQTDCVQIKTQYNVISYQNNLSLLDINLLTGYTHQIRAHLSFIGNPVLGDNKYGNKTFNKQYHLNKQCLCAYKIIFKIDSANKLNYLNNITLQINPSFNFNKISKQEK